MDLVTIHTEKRKVNLSTGVQNVIYDEMVAEMRVPDWAEVVGEDPPPIDVWLENLDLEFEWVALNVQPRRPEGSSFVDLKAYCVTRKVRFFWVPQYAALNLPRCSHEVVYGWSEAGPVLVSRGEYQDILVLHPELGRVYSLA